jgi:hypothetical protein
MLRDTFRPRFLGQATLAQGPAPSVPLMVSPYSPLIIPSFDVTIKNKGVSKTLKVNFDTGLGYAHLQLPSTVARELGVTPTGSELFSDASKTFFAKTGRIDSLLISGNKECIVANPTVVFYDNAPLMIGNKFINDIGAKISYVDGVPKIYCDLSQKPNGVSSPTFVIVLTNDGISREYDAVFDTGFSSILSVPALVGWDLNLEPYKTEKARTHTGTVDLKVAKVKQMVVKGLPSCPINDFEIHIMPPSSPIKSLVVGEEFFEKVNGTLGYDTKGAFFSCQGSKDSVRSVGDAFIKDDDRYTEDYRIVPILILSALGIAVLSGIIYTYSDP